MLARGAAAVPNRLLDSVFDCRQPIQFGVSFPMYAHCARLIRSARFALHPGNTAIDGYGSDDRFCLHFASESFRSTLVTWIDA